MTNKTMRMMQDHTELSLDELDAISAGTKNMPTAKKSTASKARILGEKFLTWTAQKLGDLGV